MRTKMLKKMLKTKQKLNLFLGANNIFKEKSKEI